MRFGKRTLRTVGTVLVALVAVLAWWFQSDTDGESDQRDAGSESSATADPSTDTSSDASSGASPDASPSASPDASPSSSPSERGEADPESGLDWVAVTDLPIEAEETLELIDGGGPFPYDRDGITFGNYEGILPAQPRGYYSEYTVPTPGLDHRGARRIVTGDDDEYFWTEDHYSSFERIDWPEGTS